MELGGVHLLPEGPQTMVPIHFKFTVSGHQGYPVLYALPDYEPVKGVPVVISRKFIKG